MYDAEKDRPARCATLELAQEIGQVAFLFSDKTGTLTRNEMKLVGLAIAGGHPRTFGVGAATGGNTDGATSNACGPSVADPLPIIFADVISEAHRHDSGVAERLRELLIMLAVCHTVVVDYTRPRESIGGANTTSATPSVRYNAEGPDEEALVEAAAQLGCRLVSTRASVATIESNIAPPPHHVSGGPATDELDDVVYTAAATVLSTGPAPARRYGYEVLGLNRFDSSRKRMSVVVRLPNGRVELMCKGADSVMLPLLAPAQREAQVAERQLLGRHLDTFAESGLRTLVLARRTVSADEFRSWGAEYARAYELVGHERLERLAAVAATIERDLELLGATAIEDRLQEGVPDTLRKFREAGIRTWVLTGDKVETAINIGFSSGLLTSDMEIVQIVDPQRETNVSALEALRRVVDPSALAGSVSAIPPAAEPPQASRMPLNPVALLGRAVGVGVSHGPSSSQRVKLPSEARGEDPYGVQQYFGSVVENGFHRVASVAHGAVRRVRSEAHMVGGGGSARSPRRQRAKSGNATLTEAAAAGVSNVKEPTATPSPTAASHSPSPTSSPVMIETVALVSDLARPVSAPPLPREGGDGNDDAADATNGAAAATGSDTSPLVVSTLAIATTTAQAKEGIEGDEEAPRRPAPIERQASTEMNVTASNLALVVSGAALDTLLSHSASRTITPSEFLLLDVAKVCAVVVACRVSPHQKAMLVRLVRSGVTIGGVEPITMAVGDGANDVAMIQEARVGVGIAGREGSQAANAADFSVGQFRFLQTLLLVHGRWNYRRMALVVLYVFYSNMILVICSFLYNWLNLWSGTSPFFLVWITAFSYIIVTPCILVAVFNRDVRRDTALNYPSLYVSGRANLHLGRFKMLEYVIKSLVHSLFVAGMVMFVLAPPELSYSELGTVLYFCVMAVSQSRLVVEVYSWTLPTAVFLALAFSVFLWLEPLVYASDSAINTLWGTTVIWGPAMGLWAWATVVLIVGLVTATDLFFSAARRRLFPNLIDVVIEIDRGYGLGSRSGGDGPDGPSSTPSEFVELDQFLKTIAAPLALPRDAVRAAVRGAKRINLAPRFRSSYAHDVTERPPHVARTPRSGTKAGFFSKRIASVASALSPAGRGFFKPRSQSKDFSDTKEGNTSVVSGAAVQAATTTESSGAPPPATPPNEDHVTATDRGGVVAPGSGVLD